MFTAVSSLQSSLHSGPPSYATLEKSNSGPNNDCNAHQKKKNKQTDPRVNEDGSGRLIRPFRTTKWKCIKMQSNLVHPVDDTFSDRTRSEFLPGVICIGIFLRRRRQCRYTATAAAAAAEPRLVIYACTGSSSEASQAVASIVTNNEYV